MSQASTKKSINKDIVDDGGGSCAVPMDTWDGWKFHCYVT